MAEKKGYDMQMTRRNMFKFGAAAAAMAAVPRARAAEAPAVPGVSFASVKESLRRSNSIRPACPNPIAPRSISAQGV